jgi:hypothetical protein
MQCIPLVYVKHNYLYIDQPYTNKNKNNFEATFCPYIPGFMRWLYSKVHMLLVKERCKVYL